MSIRVADLLYVGLVVVICPAIVFVAVSGDGLNEYERNMQAVVHIQAFDNDASDYDYGEYEADSKSWQGSGCFIREDGVIMTAGHVVDGADEFLITLHDGTQYRSTVSMKADNMDVGFIKIEPNEPVNYLRFDPDHEVEIGETIYIYGHPLGDMNPWSLTKGIVSNTERDTEGFFGVFDVLQGDAASWPGNSGGPVLDEHGKVIGVLVGGIRGSDNMSYITPSWIAKEWQDVFCEWLETQHA